MEIWPKTAKNYHITWRPWAFKTSTFGITWCDNFWPNLRFKSRKVFHIRWRMLAAHEMTIKIFFERSSQKGGRRGGSKRGSTGDPPWNFIVGLQHRKNSILESRIFIVIAFFQEIQWQWFWTITPLPPSRGSDYGAVRIRELLSERIIVIPAPPIVKRQEHCDVDAFLPPKKRRCFCNCLAIFCETCSKTCNLHCLIGQCCGHLGTSKCVIYAWMRTAYRQKTLESLIDMDYRLQRQTCHYVKPNCHRCRYRSLAFVEWFWP